MEEGDKGRVRGGVHTVPRYTPGVCVERRQSGIAARVAIREKDKRMRR